MREAKERYRLESPAPDYPPELPELRRQVIVRDYDFGEVEYTFNLYRSNRTDSYYLEVDGKRFNQRMGWARALEFIRKGFLRANGCV